MTTVFHKNKPDIQWKGKTFNQISSSIKYNTLVLLPIKIIFLPNLIKFIELKFVVKNLIVITEPPLKLKISTDLVVYQLQTVIKV